MLANIIKKKKLKSMPTYFYQGLLQLSDKETWLPFFA
jgi:hypothetical protein